MTGHQSNLMCPMCLSLGLPCTWPLEYGYLQGIPSMIIDGTESSDTVPKTAKPTFRPHISSAWTVKDKSPPNGLNLMLSIHCFLWEANLLTVLHTSSCRFHALWFFQPFPTWWLATTKTWLHHPPIFLQKKQTYHPPSPISPVQATSVTKLWSKFPGGGLVTAISPYGLPLELTPFSRHHMAITSRKVFKKGNFSRVLHKRKWFWFFQKDIKKDILLAGFPPPIIPHVSSCFLRTRVAIVCQLLTNAKIPMINAPIVMKTPSKTMAQQSEGKKHWQAFTSAF